MFSVTLLALALPLVVTAQTVHQVQVGSITGDLTFTPEAISAQPGDQVLFTFHQKNHSVVRTSITDPCSPTTVDGFSAPFFPVPEGQNDDLPNYTITVQDANPIWVYCPQTVPVNHCHKGMVFAVNCGPDGASNSFANFKNAAIAMGANDPPASASPTDLPSSISIPPAPYVPTVTATVSVGASVWTTTYGSYPNSPAPTPASLQGNVISVDVGANGTLSFSPPFVKALPHDTIVFSFKAKNHTATQSTFEDPCVRLNNATTNQVGFDSGFMPVPAGSTEFPSFNVTINDTAPMWVYCRQRNPVSHCGAGMVFAINSDESSPRSSSAFKALAMEINGTSNDAASTSSSSSPSATSSSDALRVTGLGVAGLMAVVGSIVAVL